MPKKNKNENTNASPEKPQKQPGFLQLVLAGLLVFLLGAGLVIGYFNVVGFPGTEQAQKSKKEEKKQEEPTATMDLGSIIVNLADPGGARFLKVGVVMEYPEDEKFAEELAKKEPEITDLIIKILRSKTVDEIQPLDKIDPLKNEIINAVNKILVGGKVKRVFFTEFIIS